ncbi:Uncharacterised protein [Achromobacter ruhlandii]|nr:Uncharacterised protein [Achromobacter ruhlandii]
MKPACSSLSLTSGIASAAWKASLNAAVISGGILAGP